jgi:hypothetical protein
VRSIIYHEVSLGKHDIIKLSLDAVFIIPRNVTDAVFKIYVDTESRWIYSTECAFFKNSDSNCQCENVSSDYFIVKHL